MLSAPAIPISFGMLLPASVSLTAPIKTGHSTQTSTEPSVLVLAGMLGTRRSVSASRTVPPSSILSEWTQPLSTAANAIRVTFGVRLSASLTVKTCQTRMER